MSGLEHRGDRRRRLEIGGLRAQVPPDTSLHVELDLPLDLRNALKEGGPARVARPDGIPLLFEAPDETGPLTVSGRPEDVDRTIGGLHPERPQHIPPISTRGATSRRARP